MKKEKDLSKSVMKEIQNKRIKMKPKVYFILGSFLLAAGLVGTMLLSAYFTHLILFRFRAEGPMEFLRFGQPGIRPFLFSFPWLPLLLTIGGLIGGIALLKRYDFSYKKSLLGLVTGMIVLVLGSGFIIDRLRPERPLSRFKPFRPLYETRFKGEDFVGGEVLEFDKDKVLVTTPEGGQVTVAWDETTILPHGSEVGVGDRVRVVGHWQDNVFEAEGMISGNYPHPDRPKVKGSVSAPGRLGR